MAKKRNNLKRQSELLTTSAFHGNGQVFDTPNIQYTDLPQRLEEVKGVLSSMDQFRVTDSDDYRDFIDEQIDSLRSLQILLQNEEKRFLSLFSKPNETTQETLERIRTRMDKLNSNYGFLTMSNVPELYENNKQIFNQYVGINFQQFASSRNYHLLIDENMQQILDGTASGNIDQTVHNLLQTQINNAIQSGAGRHRRIYTGTRAQTQLGNCTFSYDITTKQLSISNTTDPNFFREWPSILAKDYNIQIEHDYVYPKALFQALETNIKNSSNGQEIWDYVSYYCSPELAPRFDLQGNVSSLIGFLGEIKANTCIDFLSEQIGISDNGHPMPTGFVKELETGWQIPVDLVFNGIGIQVKNYSITQDGRFSFNHNMTMENFINLRLNPAEYVAIALREFFGSYQFNQPIDKAEDNYTLGTYEQLYSKFDTLIGKNASSDSLIHTIFDSYMHHILKIAFPYKETNDAIYNAYGLNFNTIFVIQKHFVPSSAIIESIIKSLKKDADRTAAGAGKSVNSSYAITKNSSEPRWQSPIDEQTELQNRAVSLHQALSSVHIHYHLTFNINEILQNAVFSF